MPSQNDAITEHDVHDLQEQWGKAITDISEAYLAEPRGDFMKIANQAAKDLYAYDSPDVDVLFTPTKAVQHPFRPTAVGALSYFVGGSNVEGGFEEDKGFAHNVGKGWSKVEFENVQVVSHKNVALALGHYIFTVATGADKGKKVDVECTFGYIRNAQGTPKIFLHHSSMPYSDAPHAPPRVAKVKTPPDTKASQKELTKEDVTALQTQWGKAITDISGAYLANPHGQKFMDVANEAAAALYAYDFSKVLFTPTKAAFHPFRPTATGALSYFVGGSNVEGGFEEDSGFAHNVGKGWSAVEWDNVRTVIIPGGVAISMGHYIFTCATGEKKKTTVEFTFGYRRDAEGTPKIFLHHSSMPYDVQRGKVKRTADLEQEVKTLKQEVNALKSQLSEVEDVQPSSEPSSAQRMYVKAWAACFGFYGLQMLAMPGNMTTDHFHAKPSPLMNFWIRGQSASLLGLSYSLTLLPTKKAVQIGALTSLAVGLLYPWNAKFNLFTEKGFPALKYPMHYVPEVLMLGMSSIGGYLALQN